LRLPLQTPNATLLSGSASWIQAGAATVMGTGDIELAESLSTQATAVQAFMLSETDRILRFTVNQDLSRNANGPQDAFEVALLDANTGLPILGRISLTKTDALVNQQFDGAYAALATTMVSRQASSVSTVVNANGTTTYSIDLSSLALGATGRAVALSFDLIGFGQTAEMQRSKVTISDVRLVNSPEPLADTVLVNEDQTTVINVLANDGNVAGYSPIIKTAPTNGTVTLNADGSVSFQPNANYFGVDSFTYKLTSGTAQSTTATVSIVVNAVNDAPVVLPGTLVTNEENSIVIDLLSQATDVDGDLLSVLVITQPTQGSLVRQANGTFVYTPNANVNGTDSFSYKVTDGVADSSVVTMALTILASNDAPTVTPQNVVLAEDSSTAIDLTNGAIDVDGDTLTAIIVSGPANGSLVRNAAGLFVYTPNANFNGTDSFTYKVNDGIADSNEATVSLTVQAVNDAPLVQARTLTLAEDTSATIDLLALATDVDGDVLTPTIVTGPNNGVVVRLADGRFSYTPNANYFGADSFTYRVNDGTVDSSVATVSITVSSVNDVPTAIVRNRVLAEDSNAAIDLINGITDIDGDTLTAIIVSGPANGTVVRNAAGLFVYTPNANFNGTDSFTYKVNDGTADSNEEAVNLTIQSINDVPSVQARTLTLGEDTSATIDLLAQATDVDGDVLTPAIVTGPTNGVVVRLADGRVSYTPNANYFGADSFTYRVNDGTVDSAVVTVSITVSSVNDVLVVTPQNIVLPEDSSAAIDLINGITDIDGDTLSAIIVSGPTNGSLVRNAAGLFVYTPNANFNGTDSFTYKVNDGTADSNEATVSLTIQAVNDAPLVQARTLTLAEDTSAAIDLLAQATDVDGDVLTPTIVTGPTNGVVVRVADGRFSYTPNANYFGADSFTYRVNDGSLNSSIATVNVTITAVNDLPLAQTLTVNTNEDTPLNVALIATDIDSAPSSLVYSIVNAPSLGTITLDAATGQAQYTPNVNQFGTDAFTYRVSDGAGLSNIATVTLTIASVNDAPVARNDVASIRAGDLVNINVLANDTDIDSSVLTPQVANGPSNGVITVNANGSIWYSANAGFVGNDSFSYFITDGQLLSNTATVAINVTGSNQPPVVVSSTVQAIEDTAVLIDIRALISDPDSSLVTPLVLTLPANGTLAELTSGANAGKWLYTPASNWSGVVSFTFKASDGSNTSNTGTVTINVAAVPDAPTLAMNNTATSRELFRTGFESASNVDQFSTNVVANSFEGWSRLDVPNTLSGGANGFEIWTSGDQQQNAANNLVAVSAMAGNGSQFLELNDAGSTLAQTLGISRSVQTVAGAQYTLSFDYAGRPGFSTDFTKVGIYVDGVKLGTAAGTSPNTGLNWQTLTFSFVGTGAAQTIRFVTEATQFAQGGRGAMLDDIALTESINRNSGLEDSAIALSSVVANLVDNDGSESLSVFVDQLPVGATISDGVRSFTATASQTSANISGWSFNLLTLTPTANFNGTINLSVRASATETNGLTANTELPLVVQVMPVNDGPALATPSKVVGAEDQPYVFAWAELALSDVDQDALSMVVQTLPNDGRLEVRVGGVWRAVANVEVISKLQIDAGEFRFIPDPNESGSDANAVAGVGNQKQDYAQFQYRGFDGGAYSATGTMVIDLTAQSDAPLLSLSDGPSLAIEVFRTSFETAANTNTTSNNVIQTVLEGWTRIDSPNNQSGGVNGFEIWASGDQLQNASGSFVNASAMSGNGTDFLELNDASGTVAQTLGISRTITTVAGAQYTLTFDIAGRPGFSSDFTRVGVFVGSSKLGTVANTSPTTSLNWQTISYTFVGTGGSQTIRFVTEATRFDAGGRGALLDDIQLTQTRQYNSTAVGGVANLQTINATLADVDGSESLTLAVRNLISGSVLSDGTRSFTATTTNTTANITGWTLNRLTLRPPVSYQGVINLQVVATSTEATGGTAGVSTSQVNLAVNVHAANIASPIVLDLNGDGVKTISLQANLESARASFDLLNNGTMVLSGWISTGDGFLAWDKNGNGKIDNRGELFGGAQGEGFAQLAQLDTNQDGVVDVTDDGYRLLSVWQDENADRQTQQGELRTLEQHQIASLKVTYSVNEQWDQGNLLLETSSARRFDGSELEMRDAYFAYQNEEPKKHSVQSQNISANVLRNSRREIDFDEWLEFEPREQETLPEQEPIVVSGFSSSATFNMPVRIAGIETSSPRKGSIRKSGTSRIVYTPEQNYVGADDFQYRYTNENGDQIEGEVFMDVATHLNQAPNEIAFVSTPFHANYELLLRAVAEEGNDYSTLARLDAARLKNEERDPPLVVVNQAQAAGSLVRGQSEFNRTREAIAAIDQIAPDSDFSNRRRSPLIDWSATSNPIAFEGFEATVRASESGGSASVSAEDELAAATGLRIPIR
jgi:Bacterial Ig domain